MKLVEEGRVYCIKINNRSSKLLRRILEKSDEILDESDMLELNRLQKDTENGKEEFE